MRGPRFPRLLGFRSKFNNVPLNSARLRNSIVCVYLASPAYSCARRLNARAIYCLYMRYIYAIHAIYVCGVRKDEHISPYRRKLDWLELRGRRTYFAAVLMYKIINIGQPAYLAPLFKKCQSRTSSRKGRGLVVPPSRTDFGLKSFWSQGTHLWNSLPCDIRYLPSASRFKSAMMRYLLERSRDVDCILM